MNEIYTAIISVCSSTAVFLIQSYIRDKKTKKEFVEQMKKTQAEQIEQTQAEQMKQIDCIKEGVKALLHERIIEKCDHYINIGKVSMEEIEELEYLNEPYKALGGNGTVKAAMHKVHELL